MHATEAIAEHAAAADLAPDFGGRLVVPGDAGYDAARAVWNATIDRRPAVIARCHGVADVVRALDVARTYDLPIAVRGGGHNVAGNAVCDDGIVIDLSAMKGIHVDPAARTARAQPGVTLGELDRETEVFGLATPTGLVSQTGIAGLTLGGGLGWLARLHGPTCDNLISAQVVLAGGDVVTAGEGEHADLLWGLRGGGGNFGIVTSFQYRLHPLGPVLAGPVFHRGEDAADVMRFYREFVADAPDELTVMASFFVAPDAPFLPAEARGRLVVVLAVCYAGDPEHGERVLRPLRAFGRPLADLVAPMPFTALQRASDAGYPPGQRNYWKSSYIDAISDEAIETAIEGARRMTSPLSSFYFEPLGGAIARGGARESAFGHRDAAFDFAILTVWRDPAESAEHIAWTRELWEAMQPFAGNRVYVNNLGEEGAERVRAAYAPAIYERLVGLKDRYDPANTFRLNQNIVPSGREAPSPA